MKKNVMKSLAVSSVISIFLLIFNRIYAAIKGNIIGLTLYGGDCTECIGLGWKELTLYPEMSAEEAAAWHSVPILQFDIRSFAVTFLIMFAIVMIVYIIKSRKRV